MKIMGIVILIGMLALFGACSENETEKEEFSSNTTITLERYGMFTMQEYARQLITINKSVILYETFYPNGTKSGESLTPLSEEEFNELLQVFKEEDFLSLEEEYVSSILVADVGDGNITLRSDTREYSVLVAPYISEGNPKAISRIVEALNHILQGASLPHFGENNSEFIEMKYQGMQCVDEPWEVWYKEGNINYVQEPSQEQLIVDYYASQGVEIEKIESHDGGFTCRACEVCADSIYFTLEVSEGSDILQEEGWVFLS